MEGKVAVGKRSRGALQDAKMAQSVGYIVGTLSSLAPILGCLDVALWHGEEEKQHEKVVKMRDMYVSASIRVSGRKSADRGNHTSSILLSCQVCTFAGADGVLVPRDFAFFDPHSLQNHSLVSSLTVSSGTMGS